MITEHDGFLPAGFMGKFVAGRTNWIKNPQVKKLYSVSGCISRDFTDYIDLWLHNKYWFFDRIEIIQEICKQKDIDFGSLEILFYEVYSQQFQEEKECWEPIIFEESFATAIQIPKSLSFLGFDIVSYWAGSLHECSVLSCNGLCDEINVNENCLIEEFRIAKSVVEGLHNCEPGPYRILKVNKTISV